MPVGGCCGGAGSKKRAALCCRCPSRGGNSPAHFTGHLQALRACGPPGGAPLAPSCSSHFLLFSRVLGTSVHRAPGGSQQLQSRSSAHCPSWQTWLSFLVRKGWSTLSCCAGWALGSPGLFCVSSNDRGSCLPSAGGCLQLSKDLLQG